MRRIVVGARHSGYGLCGWVCSAYERAPLCIVRRSRLGPARPALSTDPDCKGLTSGQDRDRARHGRKGAPTRPGVRSPVGPDRAEPREEISNPAQRPRIRAEAELCQSSPGAWRSEAKALSLGKLAARFLWGHDRMPVRLRPRLRRSWLRMGLSPDFLPCDRVAAKRGFAWGF